MRYYRTSYQVQKNLTMVVVYQAAFPFTCSLIAPRILLLLKQGRRSQIPTIKTNKCKIRPRRKTQDSFAYSSLTHASNECHRVNFPQQIHLNFIQRSRVRASRVISRQAKFLSKVERGKKVGMIFMCEEEQRSHIAKVLIMFVGIGATYYVFE